MNSKEETMCRNYEIGKRKKPADLEDEDGLNDDEYDSEENDDDWMNVNDDDEEDISGDETLSTVDEYIDPDDISSESDTDDSDDDSDMDDDDDSDSDMVYDDNGNDDTGSVGSQENPVNARGRDRRRGRDNELDTEANENLQEVEGGPVAEDEAGWETVSEESGDGEVDEDDSDEDDSDFESDDMQEED
jgi:hypothetical protein